MTKPTNEQIARRIMSQLIDDPHLKPSREDRREHRMSIFNRYRREIPAYRVPAENRIHRVFHKLMTEAKWLTFRSELFGPAFKSGWGLSDDVLDACGINAITTGADLFVPASEQEHWAKMMGVRPYTGKW